MSVLSPHARYGDSLIYFLKYNTKFPPAQGSYFMFILIEKNPGIWYNVCSEFMLGKVNER